MIVKKSAPKKAGSRHSSASGVLSDIGELRRLYKTLMTNPIVRKALLFFVVPLFIYLVFFFIFNPHWFAGFSKGFFLDSGDGFQNVWNIWWVNKSITQLHQNPYFTTFLHFPHGIPLITQTMNIFNGLVAIPLMGIGLSLVQATNVMVTFSFVVGGLTMFWLVYHLNRSYVVALFGGFLYTFSSYHFAHALGHLQLVSLEWLPLFILLWWMLLERWTYKLAVAAALSLFLVILCDYYYFFYCVTIAAIIFFYFLFTKKFSLKQARILKVLAAFVVTCLLTSGPIVYALLMSNPKSDPLLGAHPADIFGLDALSPFIPGGQWYFSNLTAWHWANLPGYKAETSVYLGLVIIVGVIVAFFKKTRAKLKLIMPSWINVWWIVFIVFSVLSLGRHPRAFGADLQSVPLPYLLLEKVFPPLQISGVPVRMMIVVLIAGIIITSFVLKKINLKTTKGRLIFVGLVLITTVEMYPMPLPLTLPDEPAYVSVLKNLPIKAGSGIIDNAATTPSWALFGQTQHQIPMAFGYTTRTPTSVSDKDFHIFAAIEQNRHGELCSLYHIRYMASRVLYNDGFPIIYRDDKTPIYIYDLKNGDGC